MGWTRYIQRDDLYINPSGKTSLQDKQFTVEFSSKQSFASIENLIRFS